MAEQFLSQLLRLENRVQSEESQQCYICMTEYGTLSMETGIIECEIRLPCNPNHTFGSACIATWLKSNNNCPICRHEFFPQIEDDTDEDDTDEDDTDEDEADNEADNEWYAEYTRAEDARAALMSELILNYCAALRLSDSVTQCAQNIGVQARSLLSLTGRSETSLAAASVYLASHLRRQPKSLREVAQLIGNTEGAIQTIYRRFYAHHQSFPPHMRRGIFGMPPDLDIREDGQFLSWPPLEHEFVDGENSQDEEFIQELWSHFSTELHLQPAVTTIARRMAFKMETWPALAGCDPKALASISIYLASAIAGAPVSHRSIAEVAGLAASYLLTTYREIYDDRKQLLDNTMRPVVLPFPPIPAYMQFL